MSYRKMICFAIFLLTAIFISLPLSAHAQETDQNVVRVGWYNSSFCYWDQFGRRRGIDYEYQHKISAYTGWTFEYVEDSWSNLLQMLIAGEIDLLSDVSYTQKRTEVMLFPDLPMGSESYYIYIDSGNREITANDLTSFNGKRIGVNQGSVQEGFLKDWAERNNLSIEVITLDVEESESLDMLKRGEIDGYATVYTFSSEQKIIPVCRVGASDYYYAVNKNRPDLLAELNIALSGIQDDDPYFNQKIFEERTYSMRTNAFLTPQQEDWIKGHGPVRVGYRDNYLPFCSAEKETGNLTGALKDYLAHAANNLRSSEIQFEAIPYPSTEAALEALRAGDVDCVFPVNLNSYDSSETGIRLTDPAMKTEMNAIMRASDSQNISRDSKISFALDSGNTNIETFIKDQYPASNWKYFTDSESCYRSVATRDADCVLISNYRIPAAEEAIKKHKLFSIPTGESMPLSFAVNTADRDLYFILNKTVVMTNSGDMDSALASYMHSDTKVSFIQFLRDNWIGVIVVITALFILIVVLLLQKLKAERKANAQQKLLEEAEKISELKQSITSLLDNMPGLSFSKDAKSGVYLACNQAFAEYAHKKTPEGVIGLTDEQIFDPVTASHFTEDDQMALSMDSPYIFFEDVPDAAGNQRQFQTTKLKFIDTAGRLCLLGICQDVTDMVRIQRENATTKEAYEKARSTGIIYTHIAKTLAHGYKYLFYVNLDTEEFIEYRTNEEGAAGLTEARRGWHFFDECKTAAVQYAHPDDCTAVLEAMNRKTLVENLDRNKSFTITYRLIMMGEPAYVSMKVSRMEDDDRFIIIGITDVDEQMKQRRAAERMMEERIAYSRLNALTGDFLCVYIVVPESGRYREYSATPGVETFLLPKEGMAFFDAINERSRSVIYRDDLERFLSMFTKEGVLSEIKRSGIFALTFRLLINNKPTYVQLKAAIVEEKEGARLIVGIIDIDAQVQQEREYTQRLARAQEEAKIDALTGIKNKHAYLEAESRLDRLIADNRQPEFALVILDVNDLKKVNDTSGHQAGDQYLRDACKIICSTFKHSPVFRVGGDEFAVIAQEDDYKSIEELLGRVNDHNTLALRSGGIVIACGMAKFDNDNCVASVFERADQNMYENKNNLKNENSDNLVFREEPK